MNIVISQLITLTQPEIQLVGVVSDMMVRLTMWANFQSLIMPALQKWFDKGWEAITEVGPSAIVLETIVRTVPNVSFLDVILWFLSFSICSFIENSY
ncbi:MAG: hypothetical protein NTZ48_07670 [Candidatus Omnitrophica bacterium]|nr:hypothetical protein [Candidatus Omnitrophota bacterium]